MGCTVGGGSLNGSLLFSISLELSLSLQEPLCLSYSLLRVLGCKVETQG